MSKRSSAGAGCLGAVLLLLPVFWLLDECSGESDRRALRIAQEEARREAESARLAAVAEAREEEERQRKLQEARAKAEARAALVSSLASLKPHQRIAAVRSCVSDPSSCPGGAGPELVLEAAKTSAERKQLQATYDRLDRAKRRPFAAFRCCDGTDSPSCTCENRKRGCCSHHGGVCGCSADFE